MKIYADLKRTLPSFEFRFKTSGPWSDFDDKTKIIGTIIEVLDQNGELIKVKLSKKLAELPVLDKAQVFDKVAFTGLDATVYARTSRNSDYAEPALSFVADDIKLLEVNHG